MSSRRNSPASLQDAINQTTNGNSQPVSDAENSTDWAGLVRDNAWAGLGDALHGRSVVIATASQLTAVAALVELDGAARRVVLFPPDLSLDHLEYVAHTAACDAIVSDRVTAEVRTGGLPCFDPLQWERHRAQPADRARMATEWVLLTSGTTGRPKLVVHTFSSLSGAIDLTPADPGVVWSTFYDIRRYGGLQIFLRAALTGSALVLSSAQESTADFLARAGACGVTHISGTPSHWRRALMSSSAHFISPQYVRLSGEIADQAVLNQLHSVYPQARIAHAFATTEAGVVFTVNDGLMGFSASVIEGTPQVEIKIVDRSLHVRSGRTASCYLGGPAPSLRDGEGFVNTGDVIELRGERYFFAGRGDGMINVGGMKVYPEEVEAVINAHPRVRMSLVRTRKNPITGALVVADVVLNDSLDGGSVENGPLRLDILSHCRETLPSHKVPAAINFVPALAVSDSGKLIRRTLAMTAEPALAIDGRQA